MQERIKKPGRVGILAVAAAMGIGLLALIPPGDWRAHANEGTPTATPWATSGCFGGVLSQDPLHCYVFEEAQREGIIDVAAMYEVAGALFIYLNQPASLSRGDAVHKYIERKGRERVKAVGGDQCVLRPDNCDYGVFGVYSTGYLLPLSTVYDDIRLRTGGADAARGDRGWPVFQQVWPPLPAATAGASGATGVSSFDVSGVDLSIPPFECDPTKLRPHGNFCSAVRRWPSLETASYGCHPEHEPEHCWLAIKTPPGKEEETFASARAVIRARYPQVVDSEYTLIPVKHSLKDLVGYEVVLDRFAASDGNTVGITSAELRTNYTGGVQGKVTYPVPSIRPAESYPTGARILSTQTATIWLWTLDQERTLAALPQLLPQLKIPVDAVGVVIQRSFAQQGRPYPTILDDAAIADAMDDAAVANTTDDAAVADTTDDAAVADAMDDAAVPDTVDDAAVAAYAGVSDASGESGESGLGSLPLVGAGLAAAIALGTALFVGVRYRHGRANRL